MSLTWDLVVLINPRGDLNFNYPRLYRALASAKPQSPATPTPLTTAPRSPASTCGYLYSAFGDCIPLRNRDYKANKFWGELLYTSRAEVLLCLGVPAAPFLLGEIAIIKISGYSFRLEALRNRTYDRPALYTISIIRCFFMAFNNCLVT